MGFPERVVYLSSSGMDHALEDWLRFRLTYDGPLQSKQRDSIDGQRDPGAKHTHEIRKAFHRQLKRLWDTNRFLREATAWEKNFADKGSAINPWGVWAPSESEIKPVRDLVPNLYVENGYRFLPLVRENLELFCDLDVLFLRNDHPGGAIHAGDIDNRIKNLIDALRRPRNGSELAGCGGPSVGEDPFYVLLEDDKEVTSLSVETDALLDQTSGNDGRNVKLVITVTLKPYHPTAFNLGFA